jgi:anti-sigma-K factor RskA
MTAPFLNDDRLVDLLIQQATTGLAADEAAELETLLAKYPAANRAAIEQTVVALALAGGSDDEPLPAALRSRVIAAEASARGRSATTSIGARAKPAASAARSTAGWWAAAAAVLVAVAGWYPRLAPSPVAPAASDRRAELIAKTPGLLQWKFAATEDPSAHGASGDVVWDPVTQRGYLHLVGLSANDARKSQYQLWIFDGDRDDRYPVDGGVFDIPAGKTDVVIPIVVRLHVAKPALFAVTVERPGGVVVSGRERIAVLAKPSST